jgi:hypothetical protein
VLGNALSFVRLPLRAEQAPARTPRLLVQLEALHPLASVALAAWARTARVALPALA